MHGDHNFKLASLTTGRQTSQKDWEDVQCLRTERSLDVVQAECSCTSQHFCKTMLFVCAVRVAMLDGKPTSRQKQVQVHS